MIAREEDGIGKEVEERRSDRGWKDDEDEDEDEDDDGEVVGSGGEERRLVVAAGLDGGYAEFRNWEWRQARQVANHRDTRCQLAKLSGRGAENAQKTQKTQKTQKPGTRSLLSVF